MTFPSKPPGRGAIIFAVLILLLALVAIYQGRQGKTPPWESCRESLVEQIFAHRCTPRGGAGAPQSGAAGEAPSSPAENERPVIELPASGDGAR